MKREDEMNELISQQKNTIEELYVLINQLKKTNVDKAKKNSKNYLYTNKSRGQKKTYPYQLSHLKETYTYTVRKIIVGHH